MELTFRQEEIVQYVRGQLRFAGTAPTVREIGQRFGISSPGAVRGHIEALLRKGALRKIPGVSRGLRPAHAAAEQGPLLACESREKYGANRPKEKIRYEPIEDRCLFMINQLPRTHRVPLLARVAKGWPLLSDQNCEGHLDLDRSLVPGEGVVFAVEIKERKAGSTGILTGDIVLTQKQKTAKAGEIVVGLVKGRIISRRLTRGAKVKILGRVIGLIRRIG